MADAAIDSASQGTTGLRPAGFPPSAGKDRKDVLLLVEFECAIADVIQRFAGLPLGALIHALGKASQDLSAIAYLRDQPSKDDTAFADPSKANARDDGMVGHATADQKTPDHRSRAEKP